MENELEAWSPRPWKRPLESAATPGVVSVTSELSVEDWLSSGTLMNRSRSTSIWKVGSSSIRSPRWTATVTDWVAGPILQNQLEVESNHRANLNIPVERSKTLGGDADQVGVKGNVGKGELAEGIGGSGLAETAGRVGEINRGVGDDGAGGIGDSAVDVAGVAGLGRRGERGKDQGEKGKDTEKCAAMERHK